MVFHWVLGSQWVYSVLVCYLLLRPLWHSGCAGRQPPLRLSDRSSKDLTKPQILSVSHRPPIVFVLNAVRHVVSEIRLIPTPAD